MSWSSVSPLEKGGKGLPKSASRTDDQRSSSTGGTEGRGSDHVGFRLANALFPVGLQNETQGTFVPVLEWHWECRGSWAPFGYLRYAVHVYFTPCMHRIFVFSHCEIAKSRGGTRATWTDAPLGHISLNRFQDGIQLPGWWLNNQDGCFFE